MDMQKQIQLLKDDQNALKAFKAKYLSGENRIAFSSKKTSAVRAMLI